MSNPKSLLGVDFAPGLQEALITDRGTKMIHETALTCTCQVSDQYASMTLDGKKNRRDQYCNKCAGLGFIYRNPIVVTGMVTNIRQNRTQLEEGLHISGDLTFSPLQNDACSCDGITTYPKISLSDRLTSTWSQPIDNGQVLVRNAANLGFNPSLNTNLSPLQDKLMYEPSKAIWCEDEDGNTYKENADFTLGKGRIINWLNPPKDGKKYTLKYEGYFEWIVYAPPVERIDKNNKDLGQLVYLRKRHLHIIGESPLASKDDLVPVSFKMDC